MTGSVDYILVSDVQALTAALSELSQSRVIGVDTETTGLDPLSDKLHLVQLTAEGSDRVFIVDLFRLGVQAAAVLQTFFGGDQIKVFHNAKFDLKFLRRAGMSVAQPVFDTMLASQLLTAG